MRGGPLANNVGVRSQMCGGPLTNVWGSARKCVGVRSQMCGGPLTNVRGSARKYGGPLANVGGSARSQMWGSARKCGGAMDCLSRGGGSESQRAAKDPLYTPSRPLLLPL
eukprot:1094600-Prorocentrum_minimum.AAC.1